MVTQDKNIYRLKCYSRGYKKRLRRINKTRERLNTNRYVNEVFNDLEDSFYYYLSYCDPLIDMYDEPIDKTSEEYLFDQEDSGWLEYLGRDWSLQDELNYSDKVYKEYESEQDYNFTDEEIEYAVNSWNKSFDKEELDLIERAINAYKSVKCWQDAWRKYGVIGAVKLHFGIDKNNS